MSVVGSYDPKFDDLVRQDTAASSEILAQDLKTPDKWIRRDPRLIRLTGGHPFNCEAPLTTLYEQGFITPHQLHYVRNHGPVPEINEEDAKNWTITVDGLCDNPLEIRLADIMQDLETITLPITLVCAGNRRKEQNMIRKGSGFNWGSAGMSTSIWTGTLLSNLLAKAKPQRAAKFVYFEGSDKLPADFYGTCVRIGWAMDYNRAIMLAWKQNGMPLSPDHGYPIRVIVPGVIGGRSVKWLKRITFADAPSENYYHIYDNRVLPTLVTPEMAKNDKKWWMDERYAIYDLNVQSVIVYPQHNEILPAKTASKTYNIRGVAYNGGGIRIGRIEVSLDRGRSWRLATIRYPEDEYREKGITELFGGKVDLEDRYLSFCWCFWNIDVEISELTTAKDIVVRAMDDNMNRQAKDMYWSVMSMLNNCWFRVAIQKLDNGDLRFEHPTNLLANDGWMDRVKANGGDPLSSTWGEEDVVNSSEVKAVTEEAKKPLVMTRDDKKGIFITRKELEAHESETSPWIIVNGEVYDCTDFLSQHPGGADSITMVAGSDSTDDFMAIHSETAKEMLAKYHIGTLEKDDGDSDTTTVVGSPENDKAVIPPTFLEPKTWKKLRLLQRLELSKDVRLFNFSLESPQQTSGLAVGQHVFVRVKDASGSYIMRAYTPISCHRTQGILSLLVKVYFPSGETPGGKMTMALDGIQEGDEIEVKGPVGAFQYLGNGEIIHKGKKIHADTLYMVSGGSGITPCYQVLKELAHDKNDKTKGRLLFGNKQLEDIMCKEDLESFVATSDSRLSVDYWLSRLPLPPNWAHRKGRIDRNVLTSILKDDKEHHATSMLLVCGPNGMVNAVREWALHSGWAEDRLVVF